MGVVKLVIFAVLGVLAIVGGTAGFYYATDGTVDAEITETRCSPSGSEVDLKTLFPVPGIGHTLEDMDFFICELFTEEGNVATYNLRSERVRLFESDAKSCLKYDSEQGTAPGGGCF